MPFLSGIHRYYDGLLYPLALLQVSGNFRVYEPEKIPLATLDAYVTKAKEKAAFILSKAGSAAPLHTGDGDEPMSEQANIALLEEIVKYRSGTDRIWIVNVGDIKPMEFPISFFLDYTWDPEKWPASRLPEYSEL